MYRIFHERQKSSYVPPAISNPPAMWQAKNPDHEAHFLAAVKRLGLMCIKMKHRTITTEYQVGLGPG
jgi:hypothetical protein